MFFFTHYYYISLGLQALCVWHCLKSGNQNKWIWIIIFLPVIGCVVYFFSEIATTRNVQKITSGAEQLLNSGGSIRRLEAQLKFADTFGNKVALADAYFKNNESEKAIALYEESLTGLFEENEDVIMKLIVAYGKVGRYEETLPLAKKINRSPQFVRSQAHITYAKALAATGHVQEAEKEFLAMKSRFAHYEPRYCYGTFLVQQNRMADAKNVFTEILEEATHLSSKEKRYYREWFAKSKEALLTVES